MKLISILCRWHGIETSCGQYRLMDSFSGVNYIIEFHQIKSLRWIELKGIDKRFERKRMYEFQKTLIWTNVIYPWISRAVDLKFNRELDVHDETDTVTGSTSNVIKFPSRDKHEFSVN